MTKNTHNTPPFRLKKRTTRSAPIGEQSRGCYPGSHVGDSTPMKMYTHVTADPKGKTMCPHKRITYAYDTRDFTISKYDTQRLATRSVKRSLTRTNKRGR